MLGLVGRAEDLGLRRATCWAPYLEWTVRNPAWEGNPFDLRASVEFVHRQSGETRRTGMFYRGGDTWAFRFTATRPGEWSFRTSSHDPDLAGLTGRVTAAPNPSSDAHGFLIPIAGKWGWQGTGSVFVPQLVMWDYATGGNLPRAILDDPGLVDRMIRRFLVGQGFNGFHFPVVGGHWFDFEAEEDRVRPDRLNPDPRTFEALERLIIRTHAAGGMVHLWAWGDHSRGQTPRNLPGGIGGEVDQRLLRYHAARLGPLPGWSMGFGFDLDEWVTARQLRGWRDQLHALMGWSHLLGGRPAGPNRGLDHERDAAWNRGLDYASYEHHRPSYEVYVAALRASAGLPVLSEDRFRIRQGRYPEKDYTPELVRRGLIDSTMAGGVGNIWGIHPDLAPDGVFPNREQILTWATFFHAHGRFLRDMEPAGELAAGPRTRVLLSPAARSLVVYRENAEYLELDLSRFSRPSRAVAVDALTAYTEIPLGELPPRRQRIRLPVRTDWLVAIGEFRLESKPAP